MSGILERLKRAINPWEGFDYESQEHRDARRAVGEATATNPKWVDNKPVAFQRVQTQLRSRDLATIASERAMRLAHYHPEQFPKTDAAGALCVQELARRIGGILRNPEQGIEAFMVMDRVDRRALKWVGKKEKFIFHLNSKNMAIGLFAIGLWGLGLKTYFSEKNK